MYPVLVWAPRPQKWYNGIFTTYKFSYNLNVERAVSYTTWIEHVFSFYSVMMIYYYASYIPVLCYGWYCYTI